MHMTRNYHSVVYSDFLNINIMCAGGDYIAISAGSLSFTCQLQSNPPKNIYISACGGGVGCGCECECGCVCVCVCSCIVCEESTFINNYRMFTLVLRSYSMKRM